MEPIRVALLQVAHEGNDPAANMAKGIEWCRRAREMGADIALFPEMWSNGYSLPKRDEPAPDWAANAVGADDEFILRFRELAGELRLAIAISYLEKWPDKPRGTVSLIDRNGGIVLTYAKVHTCCFDREIRLTPGDEFPVCTLDTAKGGVRVGCMICFDREFPESARVLMLGGAELILVPNACEMEGVRTAQLRARAYENMVGIALANYPSPINDGHSVAFDGVSYTSIDGKERDTTVVQAGDVEGIYMASFDMGLIREYRGREVWGDAYRRPKCYGALVNDEVNAPFVRRDAARNTE